MNIWQPDANPAQARRIGKTLEELGELTMVLARISIQGIDGVNPETGESNRDALLKETADVMAQLELLQRFFGMDQTTFWHRVRTKQIRMGEWEHHFTEG